MFEISERVGEHCYKLQQAHAILKSVLTENDTILKPGTYEADYFIQEMPRYDTMLRLVDDILYQSIPILDALQTDILSHREPTKEAKKPRAKTTDIIFPTAG